MPVTDASASNVLKDLSIEEVKIKNSIGNRSDNANSSCDHQIYPSKEEYGGRRSACLESKVNNKELRKCKGDSTSVSFDYFDAKGLSYNKIPIFANSYLKPNATFIGEQQSGIKRYQIKVELKTVDLVNSMVTGFLQILGLTEENPKITTYFRGEIINNPLLKFKWEAPNKKSPTDIPLHRYSFLTDNKDDLEYWRTLTGSYSLNDDELKKRLSRIQNDIDYSSDCIFMRWKEEFLLPDSRVKHIQGASFEGFYYIVLHLSESSRMAGSINGLYYQNAPEKIQTLNLKFVDDHGVCSKFDFV